MVKHVWERDCSVQRRWQKMAEVAPAVEAGLARRVMERVIQAAVRMARKIGYVGLGTGGFLVNVEEGAFFFLEINPRLQVEHTISDGISGVVLVAWQLRLALGESIEGDEQLGDASPHDDAVTPVPKKTSI
jgi:acetyl/propionyl-CoA carboxylase alpha subunit